MYDFSEVDGLIKEIAVDCPKTAVALELGLNDIKAVSCAADGVGKDEAFSNAEKILSEALENCPKREEDIKRLIELLALGQSVKCGS